MKMRTISLSESAESKGIVSLKELFECPDGEWAAIEIRLGGERLIEE